ncbi:hypothetical protein [Azorhizobium sp. AG788]|uniref:hypothetical protein n=1 Tax=Azorhizobium sp. AG788 TaxID=2183897 RepID=UPI0031392D73
MTMPETRGKRDSILRLRAGLLLLIALLLFSFSGGTFVARQFNLNLWWALLIALGFVLLIGFGVMQLTNKSYLAIAVVVTALTAYLAYDFLHDAMQWSSTVSLVLAAIPLAILAAAFWDFRRLKAELRLWADRR